MYEKESNFGQKKGGPQSILVSGPRRSLIRHWSMRTSAHSNDFFNSLLLNQNSIEKTKFHIDWWSSSLLWRKSNDNYLQCSTQLPALQVLNELQILNQFQCIRHSAPIIPIILIVRNCGNVSNRRQQLHARRIAHNNNKKVLLEKYRYNVDQSSILYGSLRLIGDDVLTNSLHEHKKCVSSEKWQHPILHLRYARRLMCVCVEHELSMSSSCHECSARALDNIEWQIHRCVHPITLQLWLSLSLCMLNK